MTKEEIKIGAQKHRAMIKERGITHRFICQKTGIHETVFSQYINCVASRLTIGMYAKVDKFLMGQN